MALSHFRLCVLAGTTFFLAVTLSGPLTRASEPLPQIASALPLGLPLPGPHTGDLALAELGQYLFQSTSLSRDGSVACISCHTPSLGFTDKRQLSVGVGGFTDPRRALPLFNLYLFSAYMADGRAADLSHQALIPLQSPEMQVDWAIACKRLMADPATTQLARAAGSTECNYDKVAHALAAYVGSLVSGGSRFDRFYYAGQTNALTDAEQRGLRVFVRKARCSSCHLLDGFAAPLTDGNFHSIGIGFVRGHYTDHGRMDVTGNITDDGAFRTPTLRNVSWRTFFMHEGSMTSLRQVVDFYDRGGNRGAPNMDPRIKPLFLSGQEKDDLVAFLCSLTAPIVRLSYVKNTDKL